MDNRYKDNGPSSRDYSSDHFFNRDLSWLEFNYRVLHEFLDKRTPLLERLRFIDIFRSNNDEFYMKRVGRMLYKMRAENPERSIDGLTPKEVYLSTLKRVEELYGIAGDSFNKSLIPELIQNNIHFVPYDELTEKEKDFSKKYFEDHIFPILTPLAVDSGHPFPHLSNLSTSIAVSLVSKKKKNKINPKKYFARVKIPSSIPAWLLMPQINNTYRFVPVQEIICANLDPLFTGYDIDQAVVFRVTRHAALDLDESDDVDDVLEWVEEELQEKKFAPIVRLQIMGDKEKISDSFAVNFLIRELEVEDKCIEFSLDQFHYTGFSEVIKLNLPDLKYRPYKARKSSLVSSKVTSSSEFFENIKKKDHLVHFPYETYSSSVSEFIDNAVEDPQVRAIKVTLYRTDADGRLIKKLIQAVNNKKTVAVVIELKARFDEAKNIRWAQELEDHGVHVSYGSVRYKTHSKLILVVRQEDDKLKTYVNIGTGNFNSQTAGFYTDLSLFTAREEIGKEIIQAFNYLTGKAKKYPFKNILVAPFNMKEKFLELIQSEIDNSKEGKPAKIIAKMNSLQDPDIISKLYEASRAKVNIILIIRGFCTLRPGVKGLSENIQVLSLVGRLLEHTRIFYFKNGAEEIRDGKFFIGSADWMIRNLHNRVEVITPVQRNSLKDRLWQILEKTLNDNRHVWTLDSDGKYTQKSVRNGDEPFDSQRYFLKGS